MKKWIYMICLLMTVALCGCSDKTDSTFEGCKIEAGEYEVLYVAKKSYIQSKIVSPKGDHYIVKKIKNFDDDLTKNNAYFALPEESVNSNQYYCHELYIDDDSMPFDVVVKDKDKRNTLSEIVTWIDDNRFVVDGRYIYNLEESAIETYLLEGFVGNLEEDLSNNGLNKEEKIINAFIDAYSQYSYSVNADKKEIVYMLTSRKDDMIKVFNYNIEKNRLTEIDEYSAQNTLNQPLGVVFDINNNIYMDKLTDKNQPQIEKYNHKLQQHYLFESDAKVKSVSKDNRFVVIEKEHSFLIDTLDPKIYDTDCVRRAIWIGNKTFAYVPNIDNYMRIGVVEKEDIRIIHKIDLTNILEKNSLIENITLDEEGILFDLVKYEDVINKTQIIESKAYRIYIDGLMANDLKKEDVLENQEALHYEGSQNFVSYNHYSPDKTHVIIEKNEGHENSQGRYMNTYYLDSEDNQIETISQRIIDSIYMQNNIIWINDSKLLIKGEYIYDIDHKEEKKYILETYKNDFDVINCEINNDKTAIALLINDLEDHSVKLLKYDIEKDLLKVLDASPIIYEGVLFLKVKWDFEDNIYFDKVISDKELSVYKYDNKADKVSLFLENTLLVNHSEDNKFLITSGTYENLDESLLNLESNKTYTLGSLSNPIWINKETLACRRTGKKGEYTAIEIIRLGSDNYEVLKNIECSHVLYGLDKIKNLRLEDGKLYFDVMHLADGNSLYKFEDIKTYSIDVSEY